VLQAELADKSLVITDGHHRYESALAYRDEMRAKGNWNPDDAFNFHMAYLVPVEQEGLVVLPTHRLLKDHKLTPELLDAFRFFFNVENVEPTVDALERYLSSHFDEHAFCVYDGVHAYGLLLKHDPAVIEFC
jgi:uncharacterized protein (DUF1015 family)